MLANETLCACDYGAVERVLLDLRDARAVLAGLETRKQAVNRAAAAAGEPAFDEQIKALEDERRAALVYSKSLQTLTQPTPLPAAHDGGGLLERLADLYRKSATDAEANAAEARARKDPSAAEANAVWAAAMREAAKMAATALRNYRGDFSDGPR